LTIYRTDHVPAIDSMRIAYNGLLEAPWILRP